MGSACRSGSRTFADLVAPVTAFAAPLQPWGDWTAGLPPEMTSSVGVISPPPSQDREIEPHRLENDLGEAHDVVRVVRSRVEEDLVGAEVGER